MKLPVDLYEFPSTWKRVAAKDIADFTRGISWRKAEEAESGDGTLVVSIPNIGDGFIDYESKFNHYLMKDIPEAKRVLPGDILFVGSSGNVHNVGRNAMIQGLPSEVVAHASFTFKARKTNGLVDNKFFYFLMNSEMTPFPVFCKRAADGKFNFQLQDFQSNLTVPLPLLPEQRKIAAVLSAMQKTVEQQKRMIELTTELKKSLMQKLFTEGTRGEKQKQTEIGPIPESWELVQLHTLFDVPPQNGLYKPKKCYGSGTLILRIDDFSNDGDIVSSASNRLKANSNEVATYALSENDIVINRVNSLSHLGKTSLVGALTEPMLFESNMMKFCVDTAHILPSYAFRFINSPSCRKQILGSAKRAVAQSSINQGDVGRLLVPLPTTDEQRGILDAAEILDKRFNSHKQRAALLLDLFDSLLHKLMTAQIRVDNIDLSELKTIGIEVN